MSSSASKHDSVFGLAWHTNGAEVKKLLVHEVYAGTPGGNVTPDHIGQELFDSTNEDFYRATGLTNTDWKQVTA